MFFCTPSRRRARKLGFITGVLACSQVLTVHPIGDGDTGCDEDLEQAGNAPTDSLGGALRDVHGRNGADPADSESRDHSP